MPTKHEDIMVLKPGDCLPAREIDKHIDKLVELALKGDAHGIKMALCAAVPEYCPQMEDSQKQEIASVINLDKAKLKRFSKDGSVLAR